MAFNPPTIEDRRKILELRRDGCSVDRICRIMKRGAKTIKQVFADAGVKTKYDTTKHPHSTFIAIKVMRARGVDWDEIADQFGFTSRQSAYLNYMNRMGVDKAEDDGPLPPTKQYRDNTDSWLKRTKGRMFEDDPVAVRVCGGR